MVFAERYLLGLLVTICGAVILANPLNFDIMQRISLIASITFSAAFIGRTIERSKERTSETLGDVPSRPTPKTEPAPPTLPPQVEAAAPQPTPPEMHHKHKDPDMKAGSGKDMPSVRIGGIRGGNNQFNLNSPNSIQNINQRRALRDTVDLTRETQGNKHLLRLIFHQTEGIWDTGTRVLIQITFDGPYDHSHVDGFPQALFQAGMTEDTSPWPAKGRFEFQTITPPLVGADIVVQVESKTPLNVVSLAYSPQ